MTELPKCPKCGTHIEISRMQTPLVDAELNTIYLIRCGCPDCCDVIHMHVSSTSDDDAQFRQIYWDLQYKNALDEWQSAYDKER